MVVKADVRNLIFEGDKIWLRHQFYSASTPKFKSDFRTANLCSKKIYHQDFRNQDLSKLKMRNSLFYTCDFSNADMTETDCTESEFFGSKFNDTICYRTNFTDAKLAGSIFLPKDAYGITLSMTCRTFDGMKVSPLWWFALATFLTMMHPIKTDLIRKT